MPPRADLEQWYDAHADAVFGFLLNLLREEADARDVLQEIFRQLARSPELRAEARAPRAWLLRLAHNRAIDLLRRRAARQRRHEVVTAELFARAADPDVQTFRQALADGLAELPAEQRVVVHLKLWEEMTFEQIAGLLGVSPNTAASRYRYGIDKLRNRLRPLYDEIKHHG